RADLDGTNIELLVNAGGTPRDVALDLAAQKLYWIEAAGAGIRRCDLDGSSIETVYDLNGSQGSGISIDWVDGKVYWINSSGVHHVNLDGSSLNLFFLADNGFARDLDLERTSGHVYWANQQFQFIAEATIPGGIRTNETFVLGCQPNGVAVDPATQFLFWTCTSPIGVGRGLTDWSDLTTIIAQPGSEPLGIAIGPLPVPFVDVPTVSQWGVVVMACLLLGVGANLVRRGRVHESSR
ncbi:MAG: IPTL-CTERM sorting domain-containing protein, partial [Planctomycetes bacterium]|nr:IPTL-CTERM sorting domain-containing protein [Planctomycetota bacterium]